MNITSNGMWFVASLKDILYNLHTRDVTSIHFESGFSLFGTFNIIFLKVPFLFSTTPCSLSVYTLPLIMTMLFMR
jgi:hypothetical protein